MFQIPAGGPFAVIVVRRGSITKRKLVVPGSIVVDTTFHPECRNIRALVFCVRQLEISALLHGLMPLLIIAAGSFPQEFGFYTKIRRTAFSRLTRTVSREN